GALMGGGTPGELPGLPDLGELCDPTDPLSCLTALPDRLAPLTGLLDQVPVLGDLINGILSGELPGGGLPGGGDLPGLEQLSELLAPLTGLVGEVPVLGDIINQLLAPLLGGGTPGGELPDLGGLCDPADPLSCLG